MIASAQPYLVPKVDVLWLSHPSQELRTPRIILSVENKLQEIEFFFQNDRGGVESTRMERERLALTTLGKTKR